MNKLRTVGIIIAVFRAGSDTIARVRVLNPEVILPTVLIGLRHFERSRNEYQPDAPASVLAIGGSLACASG